VTIGGREYAVATVFGGVDFSQTPTVKVKRRDFRRRWPRLAGAVRRSVSRPVADAGRGEIWVGGASG